MSRNRVENPKESRFTTTHFWGNTNSNGLADEFAKPKVNHFENEIKPRIRRKLTKDQSRNPKCDKCEKPFSHLKNLWNHKKYTCGEGPVFQCLFCNLSSKYIQNVQKHMFLKHDTMLSRETELNSSHELLRDSETWPQQKIEEDKTAVERDDTREIYIKY
ncbi:hypothetical protein JTB14_032346 [Gonioctena quinquepunctata]|nr:hypothetical protein JTB14_032346 [Gonioctena quinquepunctata]